VLKNMENLCLTDAPEDRWQGIEQANKIGAKGS
jgi:hypothetical protein